VRGAGEAERGGGGGEYGGRGRSEGGGWGSLVWRVRMGDRIRSGRERVEGVRLERRVEDWREWRRRGGEWRGGNRGDGGQRKWGRYLEDQVFLHVPPHPRRGLRAGAPKKNLNRRLREG